MSVNELTLPTEELETINPQKRQWLEVSRAYQKRWDIVTNTRSKLESYLFEAEAVWGCDFLTKIEPLSSLMNDLFFAIQDHLEYINSDNRHSNNFTSENRRNILFNIKKDSNEYNKQLEKVISDIEDILKPHILQHHKSRQAASK